MIFNKVLCVIFNFGNNQVKRTANIFARIFMQYCQFPRTKHHIQLLLSLTKNSGLRRSKSRCNRSVDQSGLEPPDYESVALCGTRKLRFCVQPTELQALCAISLTVNEHSARNN